MANLSIPPPWRFGVFEVDAASGELRKQGRRVRLANQSFQVLVALLEQPGEVVTRRQLHERLWPSNTFVDFDASLNASISLLRDALGDSAKSPRFIETLPRRGYRFIAHATSVGPPPAPTPPQFFHPSRILIGTLGLALVVLAGLSFSHGRAPAHPVDTIAVLPFVYAGPRVEPEGQEYLADGLTSALITELARLGVPNVISETSVMRYKAARKPLPAIGRELGADILLEGSVLREGDTVRVNAQLIDARSDKHLWARSYEQHMGSILQLQNEVAAAIAGELRTRLAPPAAAERSRSATVHPQALEAYLKGRHALRNEIEERRRRSLDFFNEAIRLDPTFAPAYQGLADYYGFTDALPPGEAWPRARRYALKALELDDTLAAPRLSLAQASFWGDWDWAAADREFLRSVEVDPSDPTTRRRYALYLDLMGRSRAALDQLQRVRRLDPVSPHTFHALARHLILSRQYDEALVQIQRIEELDPHDPKAFEALWSLSIVTRNHEQAVKTTERAIGLWGREAAFVFRLAVAHARAQQHDTAKQLLDELRAVAEQRHVPPCWLAIIHMSLGDADRAMEWLEIAFKTRDVYLMQMKVSPLFDGIRADPRYPGLLRRMKFPQTPDP